MFDVNEFKNMRGKDDRYERRINALKRKKMEVIHIERTIDEAIKNISGGYQSFVIYGEPQSGKTEMMIALAAKLLDVGNKIIIVLLNDNLRLLNQNLDRFKRSGIDPTPVDISEILEEEIGEKRWIIFSKKNINDLKKVKEKLYKKSRYIIIDDEADFASPNAKINEDNRTAINHAIYELLSKEGIYIGVTATPARLDLNNTFENITEKWIYFDRHKDYVGKDSFFPLDLSGLLKYKLHELPESGDDPKYLIDSILSFMTNVGFLNLNNDLKNELRIEDELDVNFSFLIHTSGKTADHKRDYDKVIKIYDVLSDESHRDFEKYVHRMFEISEKKYGIQYSHDIVTFVLRNISKKTIVIMNSKQKSKIETDPTNPPSLFTIAIGGNIVSRGVTFHNLLGMFFTRDVLHKMQQDTYIQRARMFGNRQKYLKFFELWIPGSLYFDWQKCFVYHYLSLEAIRADKGAPVWISDHRVRPVAPSSIDKKTVVIDSGEMYFHKFMYSNQLEDILKSELDNFRKLEKITEVFGKKVFPSYVSSFISSFTKPYEGYIAIHPVRNVDPSTDYHASLYRKRGVIGGHDIQKYPRALHHIMVLKNSLDEARIVYTYKGDVEFIKSLRQHV